ncbi:MAG: glycosyltransferase family 2 protein [Tannerella sp.]|jgi:GT2 family glycosyltransferase|nr:glycosyltransferase family 2 protein [Tannerella sp.]
MRRLSVVIIGHNSWPYLEKNLASLRFLAGDPQAEIIYVDNASTDATLREIRRLHPHVTVLENRSNAGISAARNRGIRRAGGEYTWLLDSDTEASPAALEAMLSFMDHHPEAGLCGCKLYGQDGRIQESCRRFPTICGKLKAAWRILTRRRGKAPLGSAPDSGYDLDADRPFEVDYLIGACQLFRRTAQEKTGLLDERIFYGPEDADFCLRMRQSGYKVFYLPHVSMFHAYQRLSSHRVFSLINLRHLQGLAYYFRKHRSKGTVKK